MQLKEKENEHESKSMGISFEINAVNTAKLEFEK